MPPPPASVRVRQQGFIGNVRFPPITDIKTRSFYCQARRHHLKKPIITIAATMAMCLLTDGCEKPSDTSPIVGTWLVHDAKAPFPMHMYVFNADGTMQQANPDAGDAHGSDSDGKGIWAPDAGHVRGKWVQVMADRNTHGFTGRGEYSFDISVSGDRLSGSGTMQLFDAKGLRGAAIPTTFTGDRVTLRR